MQGEARAEDALYVLYAAVVQWKELALGQPRGPSLPPQGGRSPLGEVLVRLAASSRARHCAAERLRSVRRWEQLYSSQSGRGGAYRPFDAPMDGYPGAERPPRPQPPQQQTPRRRGSDNGGCTIS